MELKYATGAHNNRVARFNRTFMELKFRNRAKHKTSLRRFNRTFMELKSQVNLSWDGAELVLIVPLWN